MHVNDLKAMIASRLYYDLLQYVDITFWYILLTASDSLFTGKLAADVVIHISKETIIFIEDNLNAYTIYLVYVIKL